MNQKKELEKINHFKIIKIIDQSTFMINGGKKNNIKKQDKFIIIGNKKLPIIDPDSGEEIDTLPTYKANIFAEEVYDKVTICKTKWISGSSLRSTYINLLQNVATATTPGHYEEVNINEDQASNLENYDDTPVSLGDKVELVSDSTNQNS